MTPQHEHIIGGESAYIYTHSPPMLVCSASMIGWSQADGKRNSNRSGPDGDAASWDDGGGCVDVLKRAVQRTAPQSKRTFRQNWRTQMKGRPRKPLAELQLMGGFRPQRHAGRICEPQFDGNPVKPANLTGDASTLWDDVVPRLVERRVVTAIDTAILTSMCQLWSLYLAAVKAAADDPTSKEVRGAVTGYWSAFDKAASHVGLNPVDRARLSVPPDVDADGVEEFARKRKPA